MYMIRLNRVGEDITACKKAAPLCLVDVVALVIKYIIENNIVESALSGTQGMRSLGFATSWFGNKIWVIRMVDFLHCVSLFLIVYFVCTSIAAVLKELGCEKKALYGQLVWKLQLAASILYMIASFLLKESITSLSARADFAVSVCYIIFLYMSYRVLSTQNKE